MSSPAVVGTIVPCPKCQSMVQVEDRADDQPIASGPAAQIAMGASPVDSEAITEDGISTSRESVGDSLDSSPQPARGPAFTPSPTEAVLSSGHPAPAGSAQPPAIPGQAVETTAGSPSVGGQPPIEGGGSSVAWQSDQTRRTRQTVMIATLSLASLCVTAVLLLWFVRFQRSEDRYADASSDQRVTAEKETPDSTDPLASTSTPVEDSQTDVEKEPVVAATDQTATLPDPVETPELKKMDPANSETSPTVSLPTEQPTSPPSIRGEPESLIPDTAIPSSLLPRSPLDDPAEDGLTSIEDADLGNLQELPPGLQQFLPLLPIEGNNEKPTLKAPPSIDEIAIDEAEFEDDIDAKPLKPLNLKADLAIRFALRSEGYPMHAMMMMVGQITGVPMELDWVSFDLAGVDLATPVQIPSGQRTARQWLDETTGQLGGEIRPEEFFVTVTLTDEAFAQRRDQLLKLDDFGEGADSAAELIADFVRDQQPEPNAAEPRDGALDDAEQPNGDGDPPQAKNANIRPRQSDQLKILTTELLRRMRGIENQLSDETLSRWTMVSDDTVGDVFSGNWPVLSGGVSHDPLSTPIAFSGLLRRLSSKNQAVCLVNWNDANRRSLGPSQLVLPIQEADAGATLATLFEPYGLQAYRVDAGHWWIGSPATYDRLPILVTSPPLGERRDLFINQVRRIVANSSSDLFRIAYDEVSDRALLLLPRFIARQLPKVSQELARN